MPSEKECKMPAREPELKRVISNNSAGFSFFDRWFRSLPRAYFFVIQPPYNLHDSSPPVFLGARTILSEQLPENHRFPKVSKSSASESVRYRFDVA